MIMAERQAWRVRNPGDDVVLGVDFAATGRPDAGFGTLMELTGTDHALWETVTPGPGQEEGMTGSAYLDRWTGELRASGVDVRAVLGYCGSSGFALAIAQQVGAWQAQPQVILFDPTAVTGRSVLQDDFYQVVDALAEVLGPAEVENARRAGEAAEREHAGLAELSDEFVRIYAEASHMAFGRLGLPPDRVEELVAWFRSYLNFLTAASTMTVDPQPEAVTVIRSSELSDSLVPASHELRFDVDHAALLGRAEVAQAVAELIV
jgi:hypothetical protein